MLTLLIRVCAISVAQIPPPRPPSCSPPQHSSSLLYYLPLCLFVSRPYHCRRGHLGPPTSLPKLLYRQRNDPVVAGSLVFIASLHALFAREVKRSGRHFTGYASIVKGSRLLKHRQQLLEELCDGRVRRIYAMEKSLAPYVSLLKPPHEGLSASGVIGGDDSLENMKMRAGR